MPVTLSNLRTEYEQRVQRLDIVCCKMLGTKSDIAFMCAGQQMEHTLNLHGVLKNFLGCSLLGCAFYFCLANI